MNTLPALAIAPESDPAAVRLAEELQLPLLKSGQTADLILRYKNGRLQLQSLSGELQAETCVDFTAGKLYWRQQHHVEGELIVKAVGGRKAMGQHVLDATAGLGQDGFILAAAGFQVQLIEKNRVVHALLRDGLQHAALAGDDRLAAIIAAIRLQHADSLALLSEMTGLPAVEKSEIIYVDPMFPQRKKSAKVKKNMQLMQRLLGHPEPGSAEAESILAEQAVMLQLARQAAGRRVVVKRPRIAPFLAESKPDLQFSGKSSRFDVYLVHQ